MKITSTVIMMATMTPSMAFVDDVYIIPVIKPPARINSIIHIKTLYIFQTMENCVLSDVIGNRLPDKRFIRMFRRFTLWKSILSMLFLSYVILCVVSFILLLLFHVTFLSSHDVLFVVEKQVWFFLVFESDLMAICRSPHDSVLFPINVPLFARVSLIYYTLFGSNDIPSDSSHNYRYLFCDHSIRKNRR